MKQILYAVGPDTAGSFREFSKLNCDCFFALQPCQGKSPSFEYSSERLFRGAMEMEPSGAWPPWNHPRWVRDWETLGVNMDAGGVFAWAWRLLGRRFARETLFFGALRGGRRLRCATAHATAETGQIFNGPTDFRFG